MNCTNPLSVITDQSLQINGVKNVNEIIKSEVLQLFKEKPRDIIWIPHPKFEEADRFGPFPDKKANFYDCHGVKNAVLFLGKEGAIQAIKGEIGGNDFLKWLNDENPEIEKREFFASDRKFFMSCYDFVYLNLYFAELISKAKITEIYRDQISNELNGFDKPKHYGFDLSLFKNFDLKNDNKDNSLKAGDIVIGFENDKPVHILFLSWKNSISGIWQGAGLWDNNCFTPSNDDLTNLEKNGSSMSSPVSFRHCSLEAVLQSLG